MSITPQKLFCQLCHQEKNREELIPADLVRESILLNLILSLLAALQAPVIMMSQNRQEERDRLRAQNDYQVNLKAELEVRIINEKLDTLIHHQWLRFLEIQQIQMDMLEEISGSIEKQKNSH